MKLSISARSFLLVLAALVVAEGIGLTLFITRPPLRREPVSLGKVAELLHQPGDGPLAGPPRGLPPRPPWDRRPLPDGGPSPGPPPRDGGPPPQDGPPPPGPPPRDAIPPGSGLLVVDQAEPPVALRRVNERASTAITRELSEWLGVAAADLLVQMPPDPRAPEEGPRMDGPRMLGEGFSVARRLSDGRWRVVTHPPESFPTAFQRQAFMLLAIGLALLLPLAWLFARALAAPIRGFAQAAQRLGQDPSAPPLPSTGPSEMRAAVDAFNTMQTRINRMLRERTLMFGAIAHDLRTPLTRLAFRLEDLPAPLNQKVTADIQEMKTMITAALEFIRERETTGVRERLDLRSLLDRIVDDLTDLGHDVSFNAGAPVVLTGDPLALRRMLVNLVENALKYGDRARLRLHVEAGSAVVEIDDDGPGIPQGHQQQVFEPFFRLENSRNRDTGGIGLGLSTARSIVLDHGGEITLGNRSGGGLRVTVRLPMTE